MPRMKLRYLPLIVLIALVFNVSVSAQDKRTTETKIADVLALFPAATSDDADRLFKELISLPDEGLDGIVSRIQPNGKPEGVPVRYAVSLLTHHKSTRQEKARIEAAYLRGLDRLSNAEVLSYLMENLKVIGTDASVAKLAAILKDKNHAQQAIATLASIGTPSARTALHSALEQTNDVAIRARLIQGLGELRHQPSAGAIAKYAKDADPVVKKHALASLALIADPASADVLLQEARAARFQSDLAEAVPALLDYIDQVAVSQNNALVVKLSQEVLANTLDASQQHFRLAALKALTKAQPENATKTLTKDLARFDSEYQKEVLKIASPGLSNTTATQQWLKIYKKNKTLKADILAMLASANRNDAFAESTLLPALKAKDPAVRITAVQEIAYSKNKKFQAPVLDYLFGTSDDAEIDAAKQALLRMLDDKEAAALAGRIASAQPKQKAVLIGILGERRATKSFDVVLEHTSSDDAGTRRAAFTALPRVSSPGNTASLLALLGKARTDDETKAVQAALIEAMDERAYALINAAYDQNKARILPLLPYVKDEQALVKVQESFKSGTAEEKAAAFDALLNWQDHTAARTLLGIRKDPNLRQYHEKAFAAFVSQVSQSAWPDDQKLLMLGEAMEQAKTTAEKVSVIRAVGNLRTFLAFMFAARYVDDKDLGRAASRSVMQIALPTADARPGLTGALVRSTLQKTLDKLEGQDSQYEKIDIETYLANMPYTKGFEPIFNGKDLSGWQGLVGNPISRSKMKKAELEKLQREANEKMKDNWTVKDGAIWFSGRGANLCTTRQYGDFEMLVDWKISRDGDSGIYLRGSPQVQIWDPWGSHENARVGSGGLFNNKQNPSNPLVVADNPVGEWNTFHIKMVGDRVTVHLNGVLVVDNVVMENYWDRSIPIFPEEAIELQAHGNELAFRNIYVKELGSKPYELTPEEKAQGFELLFNGKDLDNWVGNKTEYVIEDNAIAIYPKGKGHGNLYTANEYSDFIFRFEFQLTPGANNGLGIHAPLSGDAAYGGKEIQILDDTAPVYAKLQPYQYHGSVYGLVPAKRGYLKPVGEWNEEEVLVQGDRIKVTLNGTVILDADLKKATKNGTLDKREHPGLNRHSGHIAFLGHGTVVRFKNIRVKDLSKK